MTSEVHDLQDRIVISESCIICKGFHYMSVIDPRYWLDPLRLIAKASNMAYSCAWVPSEHDGFRQVMLLT
jgi:hypothetical protein